MRKLLTMLCAFALLISPISMDAKKKETKKIVPQMANYPSANIDEFRMHGGDVVLKSRVIMPDSLTKAQIAELSKILSELGITAFIRNNVTGKKTVRSLTYDDDFTINTTVHVPYPMFVSVSPFADLYMCPGDTVEFVLDVTAQTKEESLHLDGTGVSGEINRLISTIDKNYCEHHLQSYIVENVKQLDSLMIWRDEQIARMDSMVYKMNAGLPELQGCSPLASDIIRTYILVHYLNIIVCSYSSLPDLEFDHKIFRSNYFDFLASREKYLLDNPLLMMSTDWILFNQLEFSAFSPALGFYSFYPSDYNAISYETIDSDCTPRVNFCKWMQKISDELHLSKNDFMAQVCMMRRVFGVDWKNDEFAEMFAAMMPYITNPELARQATLAYRNYVKEHETQVADNKPMTKGDSIFQRIIASYAGNVLVLDFWEMSCGPCRAGMLEDRNIVEQYKDKPIKFLYITDSDPKESEEWMKESNIHGEHIFISKSEWSKMMEKFNFSAIPFHAIVDKKGRIRTDGLSFEKLMEE